MCTLGVPKWSALCDIPPAGDDVNLTPKGVNLTPKGVNLTPKGVNLTPKGVD